MMHHLQCDGRHLPPSLPFSSRLLSTATPRAYLQIENKRFSKESLAKSSVDARARNSGLPHQLK